LAEREFGEQVGDVGLGHAVADVQLSGGRPIARMIGEAELGERCHRRGIKS
jgi:hypothetical protein